jgi:hypothetical protein
MGMARRSRAGGCSSQKEDFARILDTMAKLGEPREPLRCKIVETDMRTVVAGWRFFKYDALSSVCIHLQEWIHSARLSNQRTRRHNSFEV